MKRGVSRGVDPKLSALLEKHPHNIGHCVLCEKESIFIELEEWLRDHYICYQCGSIPRHRALVSALNLFVPNWRNLSLHESSPGNALSDFLKRSSADYSSSHYYEDVPRGEYKGDHRSEDLSRLTYKDNSFDVLVTSDVFEHVLEPQKAFKEIARVLKPGGVHIFTMPWYGTLEKSVQRVKLTGNKMKHLLEPVYHGNPISGEGSIVTYDWGKDFSDIIHKASGMTTTTIVQKDRSLGLEAEFLEVFVSRNPLKLTGH